MKTPTRTQLRTLAEHITTDGVVILKDTADELAAWLRSVADAGTDAATTNENLWLLAVANTELGGALIERLVEVGTLRERLAAMTAERDLLVDLARRMGETRSEAGKLAAELRLMAAAGCLDGYAIRPDGTIVATSPTVGGGA